jgi:hypothetical protein
MDPVIKRIPDLRAAEPLKSSDLFVVSQYIQGANKVRKVSLAKLKESIIAGFPQDPTGGGGGGGGGGNIVIDENTVAVRINNQFIQWSFEDGPWYNLITLNELRSAAVPQVNFFTGDNAQLEFGPVPGLISDNPNKCLVVVGGVVQQPIVSYTLSLEDGGKLLFSEAPPAVSISIQPY